MDKSKTEAVAQAVLEPGLQAQEDLRRKRAAEAAQLVRQQRVAWFALAGSALGAGGAYVSGAHFLLGFTLGGIIGTTVGWFATRRAPA